MRFASGEGHGILWIATGALIFQIASNLDQLGTALGQVYEVQIKRIR